jgi:TetR/AcrR family transcriptional repressor of mexJK operon
MKARVSPTLARPSKRGAKRLAAIIAAAEREFLDKGYEGTSLDAVARRAGASKATIYSYFINKVGLFRAILADKLNQVFSSLKVADLAHVPIERALTGVGKAFLGLLLSSVGIKFYRLMASQGVEFPDLAAAWFENGPRKMIGGLGAFLKARAAAGEIEVADPEQSAEFFLMMLRGVLHLRAVTGLSRPPYDAEIASKVDAAVAMFLRAHAPARRRPAS